MKQIEGSQKTLMRVLLFKNGHIVNHLRADYWLKHYATFLKLR